MDSSLIGGIIVAVIAAVSGARAASFFNERSRKKERTISADSESVVDTLFTSLQLSDGAQEELRLSRIVRLGGAGPALKQLAKSGDRTTDSILAICGRKGNYSKEYYKLNFSNCRRVTRVFSYEAILNEITEKGDRFALNGLKNHLDSQVVGDCEVQVRLIPKGKRILDVGDADFNPPLSFGLAILLNGNQTARMAVLHWEVSAKALWHLIAIEGIIVGDEQKELLRTLVDLHHSIDGDGVKKSESEDGLRHINDAIDELEAEWVKKKKEKTTE